MLTTLRRLRNVSWNLDNVTADLSYALREVNNVLAEGNNVTEKLDNTPKKETWQLQYPHPLAIKNPPSSAGRA